MPDASPRSVTSSPVEPAREPVVREAHAREARPRVGFGAVQPRQLRDRERGERHRCRTPAPSRRRRAGSRSHAASGADSVSFHSLAGPDDLVRGRRARPGRAADRRPRSRRRQRSSGGRAAISQRVPPGVRVLLATRRRGGRVRCATLGDERAGLGVAHFDLRRLRRRVDPEHDAAAYASARSMHVMEWEVLANGLRARGSADRSTPTGRCCSPTCSAAACTASRRRRGRRPSCRSGAGVGGLAVHSRRRHRVFRPRHRPRARRRRPARCCTSTASRVGTTCAPTRRAACTPVRCGSPCSIATPTRFRASCGASIADVDRDRSSTTSCTRTASRCRPTSARSTSSDTRARAHASCSTWAARRAATSTCRRSAIPTAWRSTSWAVWVALVGGGIGRFTPDGTLDRRLEPPSAMTTSLCFDGPDLYVTTGGHTEQPELRGCVLRTASRRAGCPAAGRARARRRGRGDRRDQRVALARRRAGAR